MKWADVPQIFRYRNCTLSYIANVLVMVGFWGVVSFGTTYWVNEGGLTLSQTGTMTSISGIHWPRVGLCHSADTGPDRPQTIGFHIHHLYCRVHARPVSDQGS